MTLSDPVRQQIDDLVRSHKVVLFMKGTRRFPQCGFSQAVVHILDGLLPAYETVNVLADPALREGVKAYSEWPTIPQLYVDAKFVGGCDIVRELHASGELRRLLGVASEPSAAAQGPVSIAISPNAAEAIKAAAEDAGGDPLRLEISASFANDLYFDARRPDDVEVVSHGVTLLLDPASAARANGVSIEYVSGPSGAGFRIDNPNEIRVKPIGAQELRDRIAAGALVLVDVRPEAERAIASIDGAVALDDGGRSRLEALDRAIPVVFYCHHGIRSQAAAQAYLRAGFKNVFNLEGGIDAWSRTVDPSVPRY